MKHASFLSFTNLSVFLWLTAFVCALYPINALQLPLFAACCLITLIWSFVALSKKMEDGWSLPSSWVLYLAGAFWALVAFSLTWSQVKSVSLMGFCMFSVMPLTFFTGVIAFKDDFFKKSATALAVIFALLSVWAIIQFFFLNNYFKGQATHPLADPSSLAALLSMGFVGALGWVLSTKSKYKNMAVALAVLILCGIISTVARGPVLALVPALVVMGWVLWPYVKAQKKALVLITLCGVLFYGLSSLGLEKRLDIGQRFLGTFENGLGGEQGRLTIWRSAKEMIEDRPVLGTGMGTFFLYYPQYREKEAFNTITLVHNDPLQFWVELGVMGPVLFYAFIIAAAMRTRRALRLAKDEKFSHDKLVVGTSFSALVALVAGCHVGFSHYNLSILMIEGFLLAVWFLATGRMLGEKTKTSQMPEKIPMALNKALLAVPFCIAGFMFISIVGGELYANKASDSLFKEDMFGFAQDINNASRISQDMNYRVYILAVNVPLAILDFKKDNIQEDDALQLYNQAKGYMSRAMELNPQSGVVYYYLGKLQTMMPPQFLPKEDMDAQSYFKQALLHDKTHYASRLALLKIMTERGDSLPSRLEMMREGENFTYNMEGAGAYYAALGHLYLESKDYGKAKEIAQKALALQERARQSNRRQSASLPQVLMGGDDKFYEAP